MTNETNLPWKQLVLYHQEITRRSEEKFFALFRKQDEPSEEWVFLSDDQIPDITGPWSIPLDDIESQGLQQKLRMDEVQELYIGGPLWVQNRALFGNKWLPHVHPFFLKEVRFNLQDEVLDLEPAPGDWEISPLAFKGLERSEMAPGEETEEALLKLLQESAKEPAEAMQLSRWLRQRILDRYPIFESFFNNSDITKVRYTIGSWVLFTPGETGPISRHLLNDYRDLQGEIEAGRLGGLGLLEGVSFPESGDAGEGTEEREEEEVLPIVPLNESQEKAVKGILQRNPVTVISGPPGCGKSQVVVSAILNAWSRGLSVLFASNNNQAVDVVKERLYPFETYTPIAVRAGSNAASTIENDLTTTASHIAALAVKTPSSGKQGSDQTAQLLDLRRRLHQFLDSRLPEQIEQGVQAASRAYGEFLKTGNRIDHQWKELENRKSNMGLEAVPFEALPETFAAARAWKASGQELIEERNQQRREMEDRENRRQASMQEMIRIMQLLGLDTEEFQDWSWILRNEGPAAHQQWFEAARTIFEGPIDNRLTELEWDSRWDFWSSSAHCEAWRAEADQAIKDIRNLLAEAEPVIARLDELDRDFSKLARQIMDYGFPKEWHCGRSIVDDWNSEYARFISTEKTLFSWIPFGERSSAVRAMRRGEKELRRAIPLTVWRRIGQMNEEGRHALAEIMELASEYLQVRERWLEYSDKREGLEKQFSELKKNISSIGITDLPSWIDVAPWNRVIEKIQEKLGFSEEARAKWLLREDRERAIREIQELHEAFFRLDSGFPLKKSWMSKEGAAFCTALDQCPDLSKPDRIDAFRTQLYSGTFQQFIAHWSDIRALKETGDSLEKELQNFAPEKLFLSRWLADIPEPLSKAPFISLPEKGSESLGWFQEGENLLGDYSHFSTETLPELEKQKEQEYQWARQNLQQVFDLLPDSTEQQQLKEHYASLFQEQKEWPMQELIERFRRFDTRWIGDQIEKVNRKLCDFTFDRAKAQWAERVKAEPELPHQLQALLNHYRRNRKRLKPEGYDLFRQALTALPVWITTAQSPQSIPMVEKIFDLVIIDEATQCTLTNLFPLIFRGKRLVVIGDPEQLPAIPGITGNNERPLAMKFGVSDYIESFGHDNNTVYSAASRCLPGRHSDIVLLREHYRSHPLIIGFSNLHIYQSLLKLRRNPSGKLGSPQWEGVSLIDVSGRASRGSGNRSWMNREEAEGVVMFLKELYQSLDNSAVSVGVVTPFRAQKEYIIDLLDREHLPKITVGTAHAFQGDERDIMVFSPVAAPGISPESVHWIEEPRNLVNVAVTRARESMVLVGNSEFLRERTGILGKLSSYIHQVDELRTKGVEELALYSWMVLSGWNPEVLKMVGDDEVTFLLKQSGVALAMLVGEGDAGLEERLAGRGCKPLLIDRRAIRETPALVLKSIVDSLAYDFNELLDLLPQSFRSGTAGEETHVSAAP